MLSPRSDVEKPPSLSPRDLIYSPTSSRGNVRRPSQRQMLEMAFEGDSLPQSVHEYSDTGVVAGMGLSPRTNGSRNDYSHRSNGAYDLRRPHSASLDYDDSNRLSSGSWHDVSTVLVPTTPSHGMYHSSTLHIDDDTAILEQDNPELFRQGVLEHAARLGIDPHTEPELMWIARDSLVAQLPEGWVLQHASSTNSPYYYHIETGVSQWDHPLDERFRQLVDEYKRRLSYDGASMSASEGMHTASFYDQQRYGDGAVATAWQGEYDSAGRRLSYDNTDYNGWRNDPALDPAVEYYQSYDGTSATGSSSKGYEDYSDLDVADSRSTLIASGRETYVRGSGATSPSLAELEALKTQVQELETRNKELEDLLGQTQIRTSDAAIASHSEFEALRAQLEELERNKKELEEQRCQDDELIVKLENQLKIMSEHEDTKTDLQPIPFEQNGRLEAEIESLRASLDASNGLVEKNTKMEAELNNLRASLDASNVLVEQNEKLEAEVKNLRASLDASNDEIERLQSISESVQGDLDALQRDRSQDEASADEEKLRLVGELDELRRESDKKASSRQKLQEDILLLREQAEKTRTELDEAHALTKKFEEDLLRSTLREQDGGRDALAIKNALTAAEDQIHALRAQLEDSDCRLRTAEAELEASRSYLESMEQEKSRVLEACHLDYRQQIASLNEQFETKNNELATSNDTLRVALEEKTALETKLEQHIQYTEMLKAEADDQRRTLKRDIRVLERDLKALQSVSIEREDELTAAKHVIADLEQKLSEQDAVVEAAKRSAHEEAEKAAGEIVRQVEAEKARVAELYTKEMQTRRKLHNRLMELQGNIRVFCRVRPIQAVELKSEQSSPAVYFRDNDPLTLDLVVGGELASDGKLLNGAGQKHQFEFDHIFQPESSQDQVFEQTQTLVTSALDGFNVCIFAYGQTGSGKTHTMEGTDQDPGIYYRSLVELFKIREERTTVGDFECSMKLSMLEVYNETIVDLLDNASPTSGMDQRKGLEARLGKQGVYVDNLIEVEVYNEKDVTDLMKLGKSHRSVGAHDFNEHSSRSHLVLSIAIETFTKSENKRRLSKLHLIDLAGSERVSKTAASGQRLKEAQNINRSLSALGDVISALGTSSKHVPYRNSKLTFLLQESLSGNSKVLMFVNVSPVQWNAPETLCSLNFASRCRNVALGMAKANTSNGSDTSSASPSGSKEPTRSVNTITTASGTKHRPPIPSPSVKGTKPIVFG